MQSSRTIKHDDSGIPQIVRHFIAILKMKTSLSSTAQGSGVYVIRFNTPIFLPPIMYNLSHVQSRALNKRLKNQSVQVRGVIRAWCRYLCPTYMRREIRR